MIDFEKELGELLALEQGPPETDEFAILADEGNRVLSALNKKQVDISLQVEEIYDIVRECGGINDALLSERSKAARLIDAVVGLTDLLDSFLRFATVSGQPELENQARIMKKNAGMLLEKCAFISFGEAGEPLDPELHTVYSVEASDYPREYVVSVLESGYRYMGAVIRKATVTVSAGTGEQRDEGNAGSAIGNERPAVGNERSAIGNERSAVGNERPATGNERPAVGNERPATGNERPAVGNKKPAAKTGGKRSVKKRSSGGLFKLFSGKPKRNG